MWILPAHSEPGSHAETKQKEGNQDKVDNKGRPVRRRHSFGLSSVDLFRNETIKSRIALLIANVRNV